MYDVSILRWPIGLAEVPYHAVVDTKDVLRLEARPRATGNGK
jgi:hypothetical protein